MTRSQFSGDRARLWRAVHTEAGRITRQIHEGEQELIRLLHEIDQERAYVQLGYYSLRGYCIHVLKFSRTQSQRLVSAVRRIEPTCKVGVEGPRA